MIKLHDEISLENVAKVSAHKLNVPRHLLELFISYTFVLINDSGQLLRILNQMCQAKDSQEFIYSDKCAHFPPSYGTFMGAQPDKLVCVGQGL